MLFGLILLDLLRDLLESETGSAYFRVFILSHGSLTKVSRISHVTILIEKILEHANPAVEVHVNAFS